MRRVRGIRAVATTAALLMTGLSLAACGGGGDDSTDTGSEDGGTLKVGLAYDIGGRGDKSFNDAAAAGLDKAVEDLGIAKDDIKELSATPTETDADKEQRLRDLADEGFTLVIGVGFKYATALAKVAPDYPDTHFAIVDDASVKEDNVTSLIFAEEQGSFLVGAAAALKTTTNNVGFIGGCDTPLIKKFEAGFNAGVKYIADEKGTPITVQSKYISTPQQQCSGFTDPAAGKTTADGQYDAGADIIYHAAGAAGIGLFESAQAKGKLAIGVDSDQYESADPAVKDVIITSMLKRVDTAVFDFIKSGQEDKVEAGEIVFDLSNDGVGYSTSGGKIEDIKAQLDDLKQQIIDGKIEVPTEP